MRAKATVPRWLLVGTLVAGQAVLQTGVASANPVQISEIRINQPDADNDEYFELSGTPSESISGLTYLVIGDGTGGSGVIEHVTPLTGTLPNDGFLVVAKSTFTLSTADVTTTLNFENGDNVTHLLVSGFTGSDGQDLDTDDDGNLDITPWTALLDSVAILGGGLEIHYSPSTVGPVGPGDVGLAIRCTSEWRTGHFDTTQGHDTPGAANLCDDTDPTSAITFPTDGDSYTTGAFEAGCTGSVFDVCGTAADNAGGSGLLKVEVEIQRAYDNFFWNGSGWQEDEVWNVTDGPTPWDYLFNPLQEDNYVLRAQATDFQGNFEDTTTASFTIDNTLPDVDITSGPSGTVYSRNATFNFGADEAVDFECSLNGGAFLPCESPEEYTGLEATGHTFDVQGTDAAGNVGADEQAWTVATPDPKNVSLKSSAKTVEKGKRVTLTATVTPCAGHAGDDVKFQKKVDGKFKTFATVATNANCKAKKEPRVTKKTVFRAISPKQDADHLAGTSGTVTVRLKN